jgi:1-acyl-sn-glycerol-3-phosphate acyltransferase
MTEDQARASGVLAPRGHRIPAASWADRVSFLPRVARLAWRYLHPPPRAREFGTPEMRAEALAMLTCLGVRLRVIGAPRLDTAGQIIMFNQTSHLDHLILGAIAPVPFRSIYNLEVSRFPKYGAWLRDQGHFLVNRFDREQWRREMARAAAWVRDGNTILVSPEGTRSWDGRLLALKHGTLELAIASGRPVLPIRVRGAERLLPRGRIVVSTGEVTTEFLPPIPTEGRDRQELEAGLRAVLG